MLLLNIVLTINLLILFFLFFFRRNNTLPNKVLALILLDTAISFAGNASVLSERFYSFPYIFFLSWATSTFFGPLFFTYTCLFTGHRLKNTWPFWMVAVLVFCFGLSLPVQYLMLPGSERAVFSKQLLQGPFPWQLDVINSGGMLLVLASTIASVIKVARYKKRIANTLSNFEKTKIRFISRFVVLGFILTVATSVLYLVLPSNDVEYLYLPCLITLIYLFILFYALQHHVIFTSETYQQFLDYNTPENTAESKPVPSPEPIPLNKVKTLSVQIDDFLASSEIYTNPDLTLNMLADAMGMPAAKISVAINKEMNKNFFDLINEKRVNGAKALLSDKINQMTIEAIAYEAGFNSRASFYRAFKKYTSLTPSEYVSQPS